MSVEIIQGDCLTELPKLAAESVHAVVTDPPYGLSFMGKAWDHGVPGAPYWQEVIRVAKPGAHLLAFGGTRTFHRLCVAIEDAGWEIRDCIMWVYGSGFPKSLDVSKAIDKAAGLERPIVSTEKRSDKRGGNFHGNSEKRPQIEWDKTSAASAASAAWDGWGTALKPAWEPIIVARKPVAGTVAANVQEHGTGGINIDASRIPTDDEQTERDGEGTADARYTQNGGTNFAAMPGKRRGRPLRTARRNEESDANRNAYSQGLAGSVAVGDTTLGRWPANVIHDGSREVIELFPNVESGQPAGLKAGGKLNCYSEFAGGIPVTGYGDAGSAARFFYCAKASGDDRESFNNHPTVKPLALMRYLVRLVTPAGATVLDPFLGSGTTAKAAQLEGCNCIGIELNPEYVKLAKRRVQQRSLLA